MISYLVLCSSTMIGSLRGIAGALCQRSHSYSPADPVTTNLKHSDSDSNSNWRLTLANSVEFEAFENPSRMPILQVASPRPSEAGGGQSF